MNKSKYGQFCRVFKRKREAARGSSGKIRADEAVFAADGRDDGVCAAFGI